MGCDEAAGAWARFGWGVGGGCGSERGGGQVKCGDVRPRDVDDGCPEIRRTFVLMV